MQNVIKKWENYLIFLERLEKSNKTVKDLFKSYINSEIKTFQDIINFFDVFETFTSENVKNNLLTFEFNKNKFIKKLYNHKISGVGKGELLLLIAIKNSRIMGQNSNFDLLLDSNDKIEIKAYLDKKKTDIRLGNDSCITQSNFYWNLLDFLKILGNLNSTNIIIQKFQNSGTDIKILSGEISQGLLKKITEFFEYLNQIKRNLKISNNTTIIEYDNKYLKINEIDRISIENKYYLQSNDYKLYTNVVSENEFIQSKLLNHKYVSNPELFLTDLNDIKIKYLTKTDVNILVFHNFNQISISKNAKDFEIKRISQGKIRLTLK